MKLLKICFIINPIAGGYRKNCELLIKSAFDEKNYILEIVNTKSKNHAFEIAANAVKNNFNIVVAVGGDGTINEVANALLHSDVALGIIPMGSGNGLARHHKIPGNFNKALNVIKQNNQQLHDAVQINEYVSFNVSGIGFDAHVAHLFGKDGKRGLKSYAKLIISEFNNYSNFKFQIQNTTTNISIDAMMVSIANSSQFGNAAYIAPQAKTNDGLVDLVVLKKLSFLNLPQLAFKVFRKKTASSKYITMLSGENFSIESNQNVPLHVDGEPCGFNNKFEIQTIKNGLKIIIP